MLFRLKIALEQRGRLSQGEISKVAASRWRQADPKERLEYELAAEQEKVEHAMNNPTYKYQPVSAAKKAQLKEEKAKERAEKKLKNTGQGRRNSRQSANVAVGSSLDEPTQQYMPPPLPFPFADFQGVATASNANVLHHHNAHFIGGQGESVLFEAGATQNYLPFEFPLPSAQELASYTHADLELQQSLNDIFGNVSDSGLNRQMPLAYDTQTISQYNLTEPAVGPVDCEIGQMGFFDNFEFEEWANVDAGQAALRGDLVQPGPYVDTFAPRPSSQTPALALNAFDVSQPILDIATVYDDGSGDSTTSGSDSLFDGPLDAPAVHGFPTHFPPDFSVEEWLSF